ncbi:MAG: hypothetical protein WEA29_04045 [Acidimicrobiia bacterium]
MIERIARWVPKGLVGFAPIGGFVSALLGAGSVFAAVTFGSIVWAGIGLALFLLAGLAWHVADIRR